MSNQFLELTETDMGSKGRAKTATEQLPKEISIEARWRLRFWWEKVLATARALCPIDTGTLQATGRIERKTGMTGDVDFGESYEKAVGFDSELINSIIVFGGMLINPKTGRICDYAQAVHDGHFTASGSYIPGTPFLEMAVNLHIDELYQILGQSVDNAVNAVWNGE